MQNRKFRRAILIAALVAAVNAKAAGELGASQNAAPNGHISVSGTYHTIPEPPTIIVGALLLYCNEHRIPCPDI